MALYEVTYEILTEARTDSFMGSSSSNLMNLKTVVNATGPNQARDIVEAQNGGSRFCRAQSAWPV
jgi:hypothetical protein